MSGPGAAWQQENVVTGFIVLALPQLPLSLGNSILATHQIARDLFPDVRLSVRKVGLTYGAMNLASSFLSGVPVCHGSGGFAGHYAFGGRTGGSVVIYGAMFIALGVKGYYDYHSGIVWLILAATFLIGMIAAFFLKLEMKGRGPAPAPSDLL